MIEPCLTFKKILDIGLLDYFLRHSITWWSDVSSLILLKITKTMKNKINCLLLDYSKKKSTMLLNLNYCNIWNSSIIWFYTDNTQSNEMMTITRSNKILTQFFNIEKIYRQGSLVTESTIEPVTVDDDSYSKKKRFS